MQVGIGFCSNTETFLRLAYVLTMQVGEIHFDGTSSFTNVKSQEHEDGNDSAYLETLMYFFVRL